MKQHHENRTDEAPGLIGDLIIKVAHAGGIVVLLGIALGTAVTRGVL